MRKPVRAILIAGSLLIVGALCAGTYYFANQSLLAAPGSDPTVAACPRKHQAHIVIYKNNTVTPVHTQAALCDTLTITNDDDKLRLIAFGAHDHHTPYDGVTEKALSKGQNLTVTLNQAGNFIFHDHLEDTLKGSFTVTK